jgi:glycosyltransferase involved in cell wall biosynthesis
VKTCVSVVIPCLNCAGTIRRLVRALLEQELPEEVDLEIIVVDNGSTDGSLSAVADLPVQVVREPRKGPASARNAGIRAADGDIILLLDADTRPAGPLLLLRHMAALRRREDIWISGGAITHDPEQRSPIAFAENATGLFNWHDGLAERYLSYQPTGNLAFRRDLPERIGLMNEDLFWLEDFDWCRRVVKGGGKIFFSPGAGVYIKGRTSLREALLKFYRWGLNVRSVYFPGRREQFWLFERHVHLFLLNAPFRALNESYVTLKRWIRRSPVKVLLHFPLIFLFRMVWAAGIVAGAREKDVDTAGGRRKKE